MLKFTKIVILNCIKFCLYFVPWRCIIRMYMECLMYRGGNMNKFFERQLVRCPSNDICQEDIARYRLALIGEMKKMGATESELNLIHNSTIKNSIRNKRNPEDVAWAILQ